ncbi:MAG TPA: cytochrome P450 [Acidimicrobiia bacterium]|nr:cytochrome P450 [Acidimicrobiia bacterium]
MTEHDGDLDFDTIDFFRDQTPVADPYPYFDFLRGECPVRREHHHDVVMVTGYEEAVAVYNDTARFSSCNSVTGPFPGFPVPLVGDDVSALIEAHRDELPMSDQITTFDPPTHTNHRALLMRLITPKRLKENEEFMWRLADRQLDEFVGRGECEFLGDFATPFAMLVVADLLGVPEQDHDTFRAELQGSRRRAVGSTGDDSLEHRPLEFLYDRFTTYVEERRREPRDDVLTGLAGATFPDGSLPEVIDVVRIASNLFAAGQETTVRLLGTALKLIGEQPDLQQLLRDERERIPNFVEEALRWESPVKGDFRLSRVASAVGGVDLPAGTTVMVLNGAANRDPRRFDDPAEFQVDRANARQHLAFGHGPHTCPGAPLARAEARISVERVLDRMADITISEAEHGPAGARRYQYVPTFILRGLQKLYLEFTPVE